MTFRSTVRLVLATLLCLVVAGGVAVAYGPPPPYLVKLTGPSRAVDCGQTVTITATVVNTENGNSPVRNQIVRWSIANGSSSDSLSTTRSATDKRGRASTQLTIGKATGDRRVVGEARSVQGRITVKVDCVLPTPTPRPTPRATDRPEATPKPTPKATQRPPKTPAPTPEPSTTLERSTFTVGYREGDVAGRAPLLLAEGYGFWAQEGLAVTQVEAPDPLAGLRDGSLDAAVMRLDDVLRAIAAGEPLRILSGYHQYQSDIVAVAQDVPDASALAGRPVIVGDDPRAETRAALLADAGWDPVAAGAEVTLPDGGPAVWARALLNGEVAMAPLRNQDRVEAGYANAAIVLDQQSFGDDVLVATDATVQAAPNSVVAFLTGTIAALRELADPATDEDLFGFATDAGLPVTAGVRGGWVNDVDDFRPWDGSLGDPSVGEGLGELDAYAADLLGWVPLPADHIALDQLHAAQETLGMVPAPDLPALEAPASAALRLGLPSTDLADAAPVLLATADGAFEAAGLTDVTVTAATGVAGVVDGSLDLAVVTAADAADAIAAGDPVVIMAGYQPAAADPTVIVAAADRPEADTAAALSALLRGLAALNLPDAADRAVAASGAAAPADLAASWPAIAATFAPFDGSTADGALPAQPALLAARASLGLQGDSAP